VTPIKIGADIAAARAAGNLIFLVTAFFALLTGFFVY
jgi:hypothetical protein